ncbi:MAG: hypothetical protein ACK4N5_25050, partial [Myxococcales bacterium]
MNTTALSRQTRRARSARVPLLLSSLLACAALAACGDEPTPQCTTGDCGVATDPCTPNPCTDAHRGVCTVVDGAAACSCDPGFVLSADACVPERISCAGEHVEGDPFEPDECPDQARDIGTSGAQQEAHTLEPAGDADWFKVAAKPGRIYRLTAKATGALQLQLDAYAAGAPGQPTLLATHPAAAEPALAVRADGEVLYFRVRSATGATGAYTVSLRDDGLDDHGDRLADASPLTAGTETDGRLQFYGDTDVFRLPLETDHVVAVEARWKETSPRGLSLTVSGPDEATLATRTAAAPKLLQRVRTTGPHFVSLRAAEPLERGPYTLLVTDYGKDDHGDDAAS